MADSCSTVVPYDWIANEPVIKIACQICICLQPIISSEFKEQTSPPHWCLIADGLFIPLMFLLSQLHQATFQLLRISFDCSFEKRPLFIYLVIDLYLFIPVPIKTFSPSFVFHTCTKSDLDGAALDFIDQLCKSDELHLGSSTSLILSCKIQQDFDNTIRQAQYIYLFAKPPVWTCWTEHSKSQFVSIQLKEDVWGRGLTHID